MTRQCEICGTQVNAKFNICKDCKNSEILPQRLKIKGSFYEKDILRKEVFLDIPERIAKLFNQGDMGMNKLRAFFYMVRNAYDVLNLDYDISTLDKDQRYEKVKPRLWALQRTVEDRTRRGITPGSFKEFINYYLEIALKSKEELYGFIELFRSVIAYSK